MQFDRMIDWGWFYFITKPLFKLMEFINSVVHNFGVTILLLTVLVKAAFFPLANKQYESWRKMKKLQPEMAALRERFKDDRPRQQQELMALYKKGEDQPCRRLPADPVADPGVLRALQGAVRHDRHAPRAVLRLDQGSLGARSDLDLQSVRSAAVPVPAPEFLHIGVWPIIMGITMWVQMQLNPPQPDPIQQQIFTWMPVVFTFLLASFPAGLVIYWAWSNTLSIIQQCYINKKKGTGSTLMDNFKRTFGPLRRLFGSKT